MQRSKKILIALGLVSAVLLPLLSVRGDTNAAVAYLNTKNNNAWVSMALSAAGEAPNVDHLKTVSATKAIDLEAPILALTAAGKDPRTFGSTDLVAALKGYVSGGQIGDAALLNDDAFGILALSASGVAASDSAIAGSKAYLLAEQNTDGGWGFGKDSASDTNTTAAVISALVEAGISSGDIAITKAVDYLKTAQNDDGGITYDPQSQWGTASDAPSTAWTISALAKLGIDPASWTKSGGNPVSYLSSLQADAGWYAYQAGSTEDSFTVVTTAYATIAALGKSYPVGKITAAAPAVSFRIEGKEATVCAGTVTAKTALDVVKNAASQCGYSYHIADTAYGPYLDQIAGDTAAGVEGWLYLVDYVSPPSGAATYILEEGDEVLWFFEDYRAKPLRISLPASEVASGAAVMATVEVLEGSSWTAASGAVVKAGTTTITSGSDGKASLQLPDGTYGVAADKEGLFVRSASARLRVGAASEGSLSLSATILAGNSTSTSPTTGISFAVETSGGAVEFGNVAPGASTSRNFTVKNNGAGRITVTGEVSGDTVFRNFVSIDSVSWRSFTSLMDPGVTKNSAVTLTIPADHSSPGTKSGTLVFWATASQ